MSSPGLFATAAERQSAALVFSRAARVSLVGLVIPAAITTLAAAAASPLPAWVRSVLAVAPVVAFAASGALAGRMLGYDRRAVSRIAIAFVVPGLTVSFAYGSLQGLTGREPIPVVAGAILAMFALGFGAAGTAVATYLGRDAQRRTTDSPPRGLSVLALAGFAGRGAAAGALGGAIALCPFLLAAARVSVPLPYLAEAVTVAAFLGCVIVPYRMIGAALDAVFRSRP